MASPGDYHIGRPSKLTPAMIDAICASIRQGCYPTVAAGRVGVSQFGMYLWNQRGKREADARNERVLRGEAADEPASMHEQFHIALEAAKAEARYSAETRVFDAMPFHWLKNGYPRDDWHECGVLMRVVEDEVAKQVTTLLGTPAGEPVFPRASFLNRACFHALQADSTFAAPPAR
jgi:hypothetical protein